MAHSNQREFTELVQSYAKHFDLELDKTSNKHYRLRDPKTGKQAITSTGSGDPLAIRHARSDLRKIFGPIEKETRMKPSIITNVMVTKTDNGTPQEYAVKPEVVTALSSPVTTPTSWTEAMLHIKTTSSMSNGGLAQLFGCTTTTIRGWMNGTSPNITRKDNFTDLFPNVDFGGLKWNTQRLGVRGSKSGTTYTKKKSTKTVKVEQPIEVVEKAIQQVKGADYWANVASCAMSFLHSLDRNNIDSKDVAAFLDKYNELNK